MKGSCIFLQAFKFQTAAGISWTHLCIVHVFKATAREKANTVSGFLQSFQRGLKEIETDPKYMSLQGITAYLELAKLFSKYIHLIVQQGITNYYTDII